MAIIPDTLGAALAYLNQSLAGAGALKGEKGEKGDPGPKGDPGEKGETGETGATGASAYEVALANGFEGSEEDWLKSLTPTNIVTVSNSPFESNAGSFKINEIGGKCEQFTTTGVQLFDGMLEVGSLNPDGTNNATTDALRSVNYIAVTGGSTITLSNDKGYANYIYEYDEDKQLITYTANATTATLVLNDNTNFIRLRSVTSKVENDLSVKYMLNSGTTALPWEPYTGGKPSPSSDYPQEIKKTVVSEIKTHGKNFVKNTAVSQIIDGITFTVNDDKSVVVNGTAPENANVILDLDETIGDRLKIDNRYILTGCPEGGKTTTYRIDLVNQGVAAYAVDTGEGIRYTVTENTLNPKVRIWIGKGTTVTNLVFNPMIREVGMDSTYEPYTESTIKLSTPVELYGIGDVQDTIEDGKVVRRFAETIIDGSYFKENFTGTSLSKVVRSIATLSKSGKEANGKDHCSHLIRKAAYATEEEHFYVHGSQALLFVVKDTLNKYSTIKEYFTENPYQLIYELAEPVIEDLPIADQAALYLLKTFDNLTYVDFDSEVKPTFSGETALTTEGSHILESLAKSNALTLEYLDAATYICDNLP